MPYANSFNYDGVAIQKKMKIIVIIDYLDYDGVADKNITMYLTSKQHIHYSTTHNIMSVYESESILWNGCTTLVEPFSAVGQTSKGGVVAVLRQTTLAVHCYFLHLLHPPPSKSPGCGVPKPLS